MRCTSAISSCQTGARVSARPLAVHKDLSEQRAQIRVSSPPDRANDTIKDDIDPWPVSVPKNGMFEQAHGNKGWRSKDASHGAWPPHCQTRWHCPALGNLLGNWASTRPLPTARSERYRRTACFDDASTRLKNRARLKKALRESDCAASHQHLADSVDIARLQEEIGLRADGHRAT